jgi:hypothetical protein
VIGLLLALSCGSAEPHPLSAYIAATRDPATGACAAIADLDLQGECAALRARDLARTDEAAAVSACAAIPAGMWHDECHFLLSDALDATGDKAQALCATAGRFSSQCLSHARSREQRAPGVLTQGAQH